MNIFTAENTKEIFFFLERCKGVIQMEKYHPEGDVFVHTLQVLNWAFRETKDIDLILAAMLHDVGKFENSRGHEKIAVEWLQDYASVKTLWLVEHHMRVWYYLEGTMRKQSKCKYLMGHPWVVELFQLARWDNIGRNPKKNIKYNKEKIIEKLNKAVKFNHE